MAENNKASRLRSLRKKKGMTLSELSALVGVSDATLQRYESGKIQNIKPQMLEKLSAALDCTAAYIMGWDEAAGPENVFDNIVGIKPKKLPVLGEIACGEPIFCDSGKNGEFVVSCDTNADFCLIAKGDSMINARIYDGDIVLIKAQSDVENGEIAAVIIDDEATLKKVYKVGNVITLMPANPKYDPLVYTPDEFRNIRILGKAVGMQTNNLYIEK
ncbi:MAG: helix-turn-helix domain-containing protein [Clostridia bacterium]|nr:helix-turn-helix domain-containing protein [Clostridia bacterium]